MKLGKVLAWVEAKPGTLTTFTNNQPEDIARRSDHLRVAELCGPDEESCEIVGPLRLDSRSSSASLPGSVVNSDNDDDVLQ